MKPISGKLTYNDAHENKLMHVLVCASPRCLSFCVDIRVCVCVYVNAGTGHVF